MEVFKSLRTALLGESDGLFSLIYLPPFKHLFRHNLKTSRQAQGDIPHMVSQLQQFMNQVVLSWRESLLLVVIRVFLLKNTAKFGLSISAVLIAAVQIWDLVTRFIDISRVSINDTLRFFKSGYVKSVYVIAVSFFHWLLLCLQIWVATQSLAYSLWPQLQFCRCACYIVIYTNNSLWMVSKNLEASKS